MISETTMGLSCSAQRLQMLYNKDHKFSKRCLYEALRHSDGMALARHLVHQTDVNVYNSWGISPLHVACEIGDKNLVQILFAMGADVNLATSPDHGGIPPLVFAASNGRTEVVRLLLDAGASVDATDDWGCTAIFKAATYNHLDCVRVLLRLGADPDKSNRWGAIPLQYAAHQGHYKVVRKLVKYKCDIHKRGEETVPPALIAAATRGYHKCVSALLDAGTDVNLSHNNNGETALLHAIKYCQHALNEFTTNSSATIADRLRCIQILLHAGAEVSASTITQLCIDDYFPNFACESTQSMEVLLVKLILRAMPLRNQTTDIDALRALFREVSMTMAMNVPLMTELTRLVCSVGFMPTEADMDAIDYALRNDEIAAVESFRKNPRSLMDNCRLVVRSALPGNVLAHVDELPLPKAMKDYLTVKQPVHYSL